MSRYIKGHPDGVALRWVTSVEGPYLAVHSVNQLPQKGGLRFHLVQEPRQRHVAGERQAIVRTVDVLVQKKARVKQISSGIQNYRRQIEMLGVHI